MTFLLDTNVLVYASDPRDPEKRERARTLMERLSDRQAAALPSQVLAEFANVALRKLAMDPARIYRQIELLEQTFATLPLTPAVVLDAVRGVRDHRMSYYDAQIWSVAKLHQIPIVLSEDFAAGATVEGVTFVDPFDDAYELSALG